VVREVGLRSSNSTTAAEKDKPQEFRNGKQVEAQRFINKNIHRILMMSKQRHKQQNCFLEMKKRIKKRIMRRKLEY